MDIACDTLRKLVNAQMLRAFERQRPGRLVDMEIELAYYCDKYGMRSTQPEDTESS